MGVGVLSLYHIHVYPPHYTHTHTHLVGVLSLFVSSSCHCWVRTEVCEGTGAGAIENNDVNHCFSADDLRTKH
jgi:hypothetical protein